MVEDTKAWRAKDKKVMSPEAFLHKLTNVKGLFIQTRLRDRALIGILYLTAGRVGEVVRHGFLGTGKDGIVKEDITRTNRNGRVFRIFQLRNLKNKARKFKQIPVAEDDLIDGKILAMIDEFLEYIQPGEPVFPISVRRARQIVEKQLGVSPHYFRHMRLTHLARKRGLSEWELMAVAGWSRSSSARFYIHDDPSRLFDKL